MIRALTKEELPQCMTLAAQFWAEAQQPGAFDQVRALAVWNGFYTLGIGEVLGGFHGETLIAVLGYVVTTDWYSGRSRAAELFWFVDASCRASTVGVKLVVEFERRASARGAQQLVMSSFAHLQPERIARLYTARHYRLSELSYIKEVTPWPLPPEQPSPLPPHSARLAQERI